jgi:NAD(P)-dependent dehydrogenase (short-subunit alcohol dehydrogenase family)
MGGSASKVAMPPLKGKTFVVTGANSGIGYITALELGKAEACVVVCARDVVRGQEAVAKLQKEAPAGTFEFGHLDLASLASVKTFAESFTSAKRPLDVLINNAGVMNVPTRELTKDGLEMQLGTNCIGHWALSIQLLPALKLSPSPRIVNVSSILAQNGIPPTGEIDFVRKPETYNPDGIYAESKLLNLILNNELARRCPEVSCIGSHPGVCSTNLFKHKFGWAKFMMQSPAAGAQSPLRAALDPAAVSGKSYFGPAGWYGGPTELTMPPLAVDEELAARYWVAAEKATGISLL